MKKIIVIGTSGSGKSTVAKKLSKKLNIPHTQLDALRFLNNWVERSDEEFLTKIEKVIEADSWILDGNYGKTQGVTWSRADTIIWVDFPFYLTLYQNVTRTIKRVITREKIWEHLNNRESLKMMLSKDSVVLWMIQTYGKNKKRYKEYMEDKRFEHLKFVHLKSRKEVKKFLKNL